MPAKQTILAVDDDPIIRTMPAEYLQPNYEVLLAGDSVEAVIFTRTTLKSVAAIVTDLEMPRLNGQSLAEWVHHIHPSLLSRVRNESR